MSLVVSLLWYGCDLWALQVLESGGISGTGSEEVQVAGSGKFGLFILDQERQQQQQAVPWQLLRVLSGQYGVLTIP